MDFLFFGLTATTIFAFRQREIPRSRKAKDVGYLGEKIMYRVPGHPVTTVLFVAICWWVVANTIYRYPQNSLIGFAILLAGVPVYWMWSRKAGSPQRGDTEQGKRQKAN
jgi:APA family basic amino acid/polyamine antiporter